jgi:hypothetical protein
MFSCQHSSHELSSSWLHACLTRGSVVSSHSRITSERFRVSASCSLWLFFISLFTLRILHFMMSWNLENSRHVKLSKRKHKEVKNKWIPLLFSFMPRVYSNSFLSSRNCQCAVTRCTLVLSISSTNYLHASEIINKRPDRKLQTVYTCLDIFKVHKRKWRETSKWHRILITWGNESERRTSIYDLQHVFRLTVHCFCSFLENHDLVFIVKISRFAVICLFSSCLVAGKE